MVTSPSIVLTANDVHVFYKIQVDVHHAIDFMIWKFHNTGAGFKYWILDIALYWKYIKVNSRVHVDLNFVKYINIISREHY